MENVIVADLMTRTPITIGPKKSLHDAAKIMVKKRVGFIPIVDNKKLVGILSQKDILWAILKQPKQDLSKIKVIDISPRKIATIKPSANLKETIEKMKKTKFEKLPVILNGKLVGIITSKDILSFNPAAYPELEEIKQIREESEKLKRIKLAKERKSFYEGVCEECGNFETLFKINGVLMCDSCRNNI